MGFKECMQKVPTRNYIVLMVFLTTYINYTTRSNFSVSITAMVKTGGKASVAYCKRNDPVSNETSTSDQDGKETKYVWSNEIQGRLLGAYFYGYLIGSLPGGVLSEWFGPFKVIFGATACAGVLNSVCVWVTPWHWMALFVLRFLIGFTGGTVYPALQTLIGRWAPPQERGKFVSALMGNTLGTCITWILVGQVSDMCGWPWGFHVLGIQIIAFLGIFTFLVADSPEMHKWITEEELEYIRTSQEGSVSTTKTIPPYKKIFTSFPFWTLTILHFGNLWGLYTQITIVPKFMRDYIGFKVSKGGTLSSLPHLVRLIMGIMYGQIGDYLKRKKYRRVIILKSFILLSHIVPGLLMAAISLVGCNSTAALVLLILSMAINGAAVMTSLSNPTDIGPNFAGTIYGIISFIGGTTGFIVPEIMGVTLGAWGNNTGTWTVNFCLSGIMYCACGIFFIIFGTADIQPWNEKKVEDKNKEAGKSTEET